MCNEIKKGWYSAKYDSTKQRQVIINRRDNPNGILQYKTSIRIEMLLCGMIVLTDAQWYDGLFFANMITEENGSEFDDFMSFVLKGIDNNCSPLNIRRRNNYMEMFKKPFLFSSIVNTKLQEYILHIWESGKYNTDDICKNMNTFLTFIKECLEEDKPEYLTDFNRFEKAITKLDSVDSRLFLAWGTTPYIPTRMGEIKKALIDKLDGIDPTLFPTVKNIVEKIKNEMDNDFPNRSKMLTDVHMIQEITTIERFESNLMHMFDNAYNLAVAEQHYCKYYDLHDACYDYEYKIEENHKNVQTNKVQLNSNKIPMMLLDYLGVMSWDEFGQILYDNRIIEQREKWLEAFDKQDISATEHEFSAYIDCLLKKLPELSTKIIEGSIFYRMKGTKRFVNAIVGETDRMVGGAASNSQLSSDEICLYFNGDFDKTLQDKIIRYASTDDTNTLFETVIAPIEQAIKKHNNTIKK